jgi:hypothetical protein
MQRQLTAFVEEPSKETYLAARRAVLQATPLPLTAMELADLQRLLEEGAPQEVLDHIDALPPSKVLSPRVHYLAAEAAESLGDAEGNELERFLFVLCLQGLLATGQGSSAEPYVVCHASDEHDILAALGLEPAGQALVDRGPKLCDVLTCTNGREVWFDVTDVLCRPQPRKKAVARRKGDTRRVSVSRIRR